MQHAVRSRRGQSTVRVPRTIWSALFLAAILFAGGYLAGQGAERVMATDRYLLERHAAPVPGGVGVVTPEQVLAVGTKNVHLVDVRSREAFGLSHATDALSMPESEMASMVSSLPTDRPLVLYCTCPDDKTSLRAARTLVGVFHVPHVLILTGGLHAFEAAGGAVTTAAADSGVEHQGCGCSTNAPAFKLWVVNEAEQSAPPQE